MAHLFLARLLPCRPINHARGPWRAPARTRRRQRVRRGPLRSLAPMARLPALPAVSACAHSATMSRPRPAFPSCRPALRRRCIHAGCARWHQAASTAGGPCACAAMAACSQPVSQSVCDDYKLPPPARRCAVYTASPAHARVQACALEATLPSFVRVSALPPIKIHARSVRSSRRCPVLRCSTRY